MNRQRRIAKAASPPMGYDPRLMDANRPDFRNQPPHPSEYDEFYNYHQPPLGPPPPFMPQPIEPDHPYDQARFYEQQQAQYNMRDNFSPSNHHHQRLAQAYRRDFPHQATSPMQHQQQSPNQATYKILCITNLNHKIADIQIKEVLMGEFSQFGEISVSVCHDGGERLAYIYFRTYEEAREARHMKSRSILFDRPIEIQPIYDSRKSSPIDSSSTPNSMTPPESYYNSNGPQQPPPMMIHRRVPPPPLPIYNHQPSPVMREPLSPQPMPMQHHNGPPLNRYPPNMPYDRYYMQPQPHLAHQSPQSPYSSPPAHDQYANYQMLASPPHHLPHQQSPQPNHHAHLGGNVPYHHNGPSPPFGWPAPMPPHLQKDHRLMNHDSRSPRHEAYSHQIEQNHHRGRSPHPPPNSIGSSKRPYHHPGPSPGGPHHTSHQLHHPVDHHNQQPARYYSREFKREKLGIIDNNEPEDGRPSRVLFISGVDTDKSEDDIRTIYQTFGTIEELEIRKISTESASILIKFSSMDCAYKAKTATNEKHLLGYKCKTIYGKITASQKLWIGGLGSATTVSILRNEFGKFGEIVNLDYISGRPYAYVQYETSNQAQFATNHLKGTMVAEAEKKLRIEYVDAPSSNESNNSKPSSASKKIALESRVDDSRSSSQRLQNDSRSSTSGDRKQDRTQQATHNETNLGTKRLLPSQTPNNDLRSPSDMDSSSKSLRNAVGSNLNESDSNSCGANLSSHKYDTKSKLIKTNSHESNKANEDRAKTSANTMNESKRVKDMIEHCSISWISQLVLRNFNFPSKMFMCSGRQEIIEKYVTKLSDNNESNCPILRITQRWRLHPQPKLEEVKKRMQTGNLGMLIITPRQESQIFVNQPSSPSSSPAIKTPQTPNSVPKKQNGDVSSNEKTDDMGIESGSPGTQSRPLKNLISYLEQKDAAGVISLNPLDQDGCDSNSKLLYTFPPGEFALNLLKIKAPNLNLDSGKEEFLLGVIVNGGENKMC